MRWTKKGLDYVAGSYRIHAEGDEWHVDMPVNGGMFADLHQAKTWCSEHEQKRTVDEHVAKIVAEAPPFSPEQARDIARIFDIEGSRAQKRGERQPHPASTPPPPGLKKRSLPGAPERSNEEVLDKESLIRAVIAHRIHALLATLGGLDSMEGLRAWRDFVVDTLRQQNCAGGCPLGSLVGELAEPFPECRADLAGGFDQWEAAVREGLRAMCDRGDLRRKANPTAWRPRCWPRSKAESCSRRFAATLPLSKRRSMRSSIASRTSGPDPRRPVSKPATLPPSRRLPC
jgi:tetracycline repressor-like protein